MASRAQVTFLKAQSQKLLARFRAAARRLAGCPAPYSFLPAPSVQKQRIHFSYLGRSLVAEAGYDTPLYETIAEVVDFDCYQLRAIAKEIERGTVVDIGANVGITALCLAQLRDVRVHCWEPVPETCRQLRDNLVANDIRNVTVEQAAVSARSGRAGFWVPLAESVGGRLSDEADPAGRLLEVQTRDLRSIVSGLDDDIALMKIDCEGAEHDLVAQLDVELTRRIQRLTFEVHDRSRSRSLQSLSEQLRSLGYELSFKPDPFGRNGLHHVLAWQRPPSR